MRPRKPRSLLTSLVIAVLAVTIASSGFAARYKVLYAFTGGADGGGLYGGLVLDKAGHLYGVTLAGGANGAGTVFHLTSVGGGRWEETVLHSFCADYPHCTDGASQWNQTLALDAMGNLYGSATAGPSDAGELFRLTPGLDGWSFNIIRDGGTGDVILDQAGNLYANGYPGECKGGFVLQLTPPPDDGYWISNDLYDFCPLYGSHISWPLGADPIYGLSWDRNGNLYGVTDAGGKENQGGVFQLEHTPTGWKEHGLHSFHYLNHDAHYPFGGVVVDSIGNVYGSTLLGGSERCGGGGCGTIYQLTKQPDGRWHETILYRFPRLKDGAGPAGNLALDAAGNLYGVAGGGIGPCPGGGCGVVFKLAHTPDHSWTYKVLHRFDLSDGALPYAGVVLDAEGNIYGTTSIGGPGGWGVVYKITP